jgi:hypothetical protein
LDGRKLSALLNSNSHGYEMSLVFFYVFVLLGCYSIFLYNNNETDVFWRGKMKGSTKFFFKMLVIKTKAFTASFFRRVFYYNFLHHLFPHVWKKVFFWHTEFCVYNPQTQDRDIKSFKIKKQIHFRSI